MVLKSKLPFLYYNYTWKLVPGLSTWCHLTQLTSSNLNILAQFLLNKSANTGLHKLRFFMCLGQCTAMRYHPGETKHIICLLYMRNIIDMKPMRRYENYNLTTCILQV